MATTSAASPRIETTSDEPAAEAAALGRAVTEPAAANVAARAKAAPDHASGESSALARAKNGTRPNSQPEVDDEYLVALAKRGRRDAVEALVRRYHGFVRVKASSYFLVGGDADDLVQEGLVGLYKAIRDYRWDRESSFRNFAELCITRQIITAVKTSTRHKHAPLNEYVSFSQTPAAAADSDQTLDEVLAGTIDRDPATEVIRQEEFNSLLECLTTRLSELESRVLSLYLDGHSYEAIAGRLGCDAKAVDNALQRVKRKVGTHLAARDADPLAARGGNASAPGLTAVATKGARHKPAKARAAGAQRRAAGVQLAEAA